MAKASKSIKLRICDRLRSFDHPLWQSNVLKIRAFPHTNFVFLSFLLIGLPQNINPALSFKRCRSMSSCHFSIAFSAERTRP
jgi:hypothetical protein